MNISISTFWYKNNNHPLKVDMLMVGDRQMGGITFPLDLSEPRIPNPVSVPARLLIPYYWRSFDSFSFPIPEPVTVEDGYRLLEVGETIEEGDYYLADKSWRKTDSAGKKVYAGMSYRRKIKSESLDARILKTLRAVAGNSEEISKLISELECKR